MANPIEVGSAHLRHRAAPLDRGPTIDLRITGVIRRGAFEVTPVAECERIHVGDRLLGSYVAPAGHDGRASLHVEPSATIASAIADRAAAVADDQTPSGTWELDTTHMRPRSYTLSLRIGDRSGGEASRCYGSVAVGFRLSRPPVRPRWPRRR